MNQEKTITIGDETPLTIQCTNGAVVYLTINRVSSAKRADATMQTGKTKKGGKFEAGT